MKKLLLIILFLLAVFTVMSADAKSEELETLTININGFSNNNGVARVGLYNSEATLAGKGKAFRKDIAERLGYVWHHNIISHVPEEWNGRVKPIDALGGTQEMVALSKLISEFPTADKTVHPHAPGSNR
jgi:hypothetical protein